MDLLNKPAFKNSAITLVILLVVFFAVKIIADLKEMKYIGTGVAATNTITVSGEGEVIATPDIATFSFTIQDEAPSVPEAQKKVTDAMNSVLAYLKKSNVEDKDIKTTSYNIYPRYEYHPVSKTEVYYDSGKQVLVAYVVSQTVEIKVRKLDQAGTLLSGIGEFGATGISGLTFSVDKETEVERQARDKAIADAKEQAESLARSLGVSLVRIVNFNEQNNRPMPIYYAKAAMGMGGGVAASDSAQVPSGENKITSNVSITYEIK